MFTAEFVWFQESDGKEFTVEADFSVIPRSKNPDSDWDAKDQIDIFNIRVFAEDGSLCSSAPIPMSVVLDEVKGFIRRAEVERELAEESVEW